MTIIDFHCHAFPDRIAPKAVAVLEGNAGVPAHTDGTVAGLLGAMDTAGVDRAVLLNIATKPGQEGPILDFCREVASERILPFASVHPQSPDPAGSVRAARQAGIRGMKFHPLYQDFLVDDPALFPLYEALEDNGLVALFHAGLDLAFGEDDHAAPRRFLVVLERFPGLKLVLAHCGGWRRTGEFLETLAGREVWLDTSYSLHPDATPQIEAILEQHGAERLLFASDSPWGAMDEHLDWVRSLPLTPAQREGVLGANARRLLDSVA